jgi:hypothetical protein
MLIRVKPAVEAVAVLPTSAAMAGLAAITKAAAAAVEQALLGEPVVVTAARGETILLGLQAVQAVQAIMAAAAVVMEAQVLLEEPEEAEEAIASMEHPAGVDLEIQAAAVAAAGVCKTELILLPTLEGKEAFMEVEVVAELRKLSLYSALTQGEQAALVVLAAVEAPAVGELTLISLTKMVSEVLEVTLASEAVAVAVVMALEGVVVAVRVVMGGLVASGELVEPVHAMTLVRAVMGRV